MSSGSDDAGAIGGVVQVCARGTVGCSIIHLGGNLPCSTGDNQPTEASQDQPKRVPVDYRYDALHPNFIKMLAKIGAYAEGKYGA